MPPRSRITTVVGKGSIMCACRCAIGNEIMSLAFSSTSTASLLNPGHAASSWANSGQPQLEWLIVRAATNEAPVVGPEDVVKAENGGERSLGQAIGADTVKVKVGI